MPTPKLSPAQWRKSSYSGQTGQCVEVADAHSLIAIRDSKNPSTGHLSLSRERFQQLLNKIR